ncbi:aldehyde dehydrogenase [Auricularia subglabra TFB-10046 SS5]|uniref:Aldehyde dehydrogenase n=1 Tax=Auricularia subglabra (strain TFB-10046 / SS5) TaxID=717982 RepID=J0LIN0_AURST|nr:aldehyde dehydrogenase [Auricularia subglabra TFB-10046 SS5]
MGRSAVDAISDIIPVIASSIAAANSLEEWTAPAKPKASQQWQAGWDPTVYPVPKGAVLIISPWNYLIPLTFIPFVGALAAGCTAALKLPELVPATCQLFAEILPRYLDPNAYKVINGAVDETTHALELRWAHIFYTGGGRVGRIIATVAAKHVTPTTLELGGKSPVFVDAENGNTDLTIAARRIMWGKHLNSGQTCVAPDYVLVEREHQDALVSAFQQVYSDFWPYPDGAMSPQAEISGFPTPAHYERARVLLSRTKGRVAVGGKYDDARRRMEPTVVADVTLGDALMEEELFCPILAVVPVDGGVDKAIDIIRSRPNPLAIYIFTDSEETKDHFLRRTQSGTVNFNDTFSQLMIPEIPFGGHGESGYGAYQGKLSFDTFTHFRGSINVPPAAEPYMRGRYPPQGENALQSAVAVEESFVIPDE